MYDKDTPWDLLIQCIQTLEHHAELMNNIITAHNNQQRQINRATKDLHNLNRRLTQLERRIDEISQMAKNSSR